MEEKPTWRVSKNGHRWMTEAVWPDGTVEAAVLHLVSEEAANRWIADSGDDWLENLRGRDRVRR